MITELQSKYKSKELSVESHLLEIFKKIDELNSIHHVYINLNKEEALKNAKIQDQQIVEANDLDELFRNSPLLGIAVGVKDIFTTKDLETTAASNILKGYIPPYDATVVKKFKLAGGIIVGKLNCDAFAHGASGENSDFGVVKNPFNKEHVSGGSSSGSGAAVALGMCDIATGTDTGGSIRNPASFTNTVGLKPTYGLVSRYGIIAMASSLDTVGHISKSVEDSAIFLSVTAGFDPHDATTSTTDSKSFLLNLKSSTLRGKKIGVLRESFASDIDPEIVEKVKESVDRFKKLGAEIVDVDIPLNEYALAVYYILAPSEVSSNLGRFDGIRFGHSRSDFGLEAKRRIMIGTYVLSSGYYDAYYLQAQKVRELLKQQYKTVFEDVDFILSPVAPILPPKIGENVNDPLKMYLMDVLSVTANLVGIPGLALPAGFSKSGLPIGIQLLGNHFSEAELFKAGFEYENSN
jgi:aspartyl-tRNA(Asn)/glutamyl-tRNA(Gln) amidotransferase subunit A